MSKEEASEKLRPSHEVFASRAEGICPPGTTQKRCQVISKHCEILAKPSRAR